MDDAYKTEFLEIYDEHVKREGADRLREYLTDKSDFFVAPASARYHCAHEGGLCEHSVNAYKRLLAGVRAEYGEEWEKRFSHETVAVCGLLHDVCKCNFYKVDTRNVKEGDAWVRKPYYTRVEKLPYGHGEKSVFIVNEYMRLTVEEAVAINWHMGGFDARVRGGDNSLSEAFARYPLALLLHVADIQSTYLDEKRGV